MLLIFLLLLKVCINSQTISIVNVSKLVIIIIQIVYLSQIARTVEINHRFQVQNMHVLCGTVRLSMQLAYMQSLLQITTNLFTIELSAHSLPINLFHSLYCFSHSHHSGMSPLGVWPLEGDHPELLASVGYKHPEDWVGHR